MGWSDPHLSESRYIRIGRIDSTPRQSNQFPTCFRYHRQIRSHVSTRGKTASPLGIRANRFFRESAAKRIGRIGQRAQPYVPISTPLVSR